MMRSLWSGVTGLQAHQIAMDVEGNNIANVNTIGFKYSRANFDDLIYQTSRVATAPQNGHGGLNSTQIGLGAQINTTTKIFKQGSLQTTDKQTDIALQGDGFFIVSPDGGKTRLYTRNGDFSRDSLGNFVDNGGHIVQGWMRDEVTGEIDPTRPIENIIIPPGLTTPARATTKVGIKANLDSGDTIGKKKIPIFQLDQYNNWTEKTPFDGIKRDNEIHDENNVGQNQFYTTKNGEQRLKERGADLGVLFNNAGDAYNLREGQGIWVSYADAKTKALNIGAKPDGTLPAARNLNITLNGENIVASNITNISQLAAAINARNTKTGVEASVTNGNQLVLTNRNNQGTSTNTKNIKMKVNNAAEWAGTDFVTTNIITAYQYTYSKTKTTAAHNYDDTIERKVTTTEDLREAMQKDARLWTNYTGTRVDNDNVTNKPKVGDFTAAIEDNKNDGVEVTVNEHGQFQVKNPKGDAFNKDDGDQTDATKVPPNPPIANANNTDNDHNMYLTITGLTNATNNVTENVKFKATMAVLTGSLSTGESKRVTDSIHMAAHSSSTDIFDSLGAKHNIKIDFIKRGYTENNGTEWTMIIQVAEPNKINFDTKDGEPTNVITGYIRFNSDGSLGTYSPASITFGAANGSASGQHIELNLGNTGGLGGMTSYDNDSSTENISQDGFTGGEMNGLRIDETGTLIGTFTNGRSFGLAQVAVAKFTNNAGLTSEGGNLFAMTANSGDPIIGAANTAGRGKISASSLEMSNVDLSRSLTQLIVVQRGFQANSKTITTSNEMLNTLLQLKN
ncbi:flagellar hook protein FlgE [Campylobacter sp. CCUG 57310]|uniref:flagellar hook protein FlgE n=1 Tax=Campylobacter sp. CCUG 57310 TaxID=2517362 RepID=UPI0015657B87|nr:flagellar hook protein FlgE [Campylobacter sp. CCUG 57310]QKF93182.1 flagellar hook protein, epsilonproteobacterial variant [Campylobacter sp. CCUG 57310]